MGTKSVAKAPSKLERIQECAGKVAQLANQLERDYQPEIVRAAMNRYLKHQREMARIAKERVALREREAELNKRASRL